MGPFLIGFLLTPTVITRKPCLNWAEVGVFCKCDRRSRLCDFKTRFCFLYSVGCRPIQICRGALSPICPCSGERGYDSRLKCLLDAADFFPEIDPLRV